MSLCVPAIAQSPKKDRELSKRKFQFDYAFTVEGVKEGDRVRMWMPLPRGDKSQSFQILSSILPGEGMETFEPKYGNRMLYRLIESAIAGPVGADISYVVTRHEIAGLAPGPKPRELHEREEELFLGANKMVPVTKLPLKWKKASDDPIKEARAIYDNVDKHVSYDKSKPGYGNGDVLWVCDSKTGNCTDFHSLFIAKARSAKIPARFEIGFPLPADKKSGAIAGYHCWASFWTEDTDWVPVDISEADKNPKLKEYYFGNLTPDRIRFTIGRDIVLSPKQSGPPLNYFVYPHVEINGKPVTKDKLKLKFSFEELQL